jgi:NAD(P)H-dependent FMN reductase
MKKILGIIGSPRKLGNCEIMIKEISRNIPEPHELQLLRLTDFNILPCRGCYGCLAKEGKCLLDDDLQWVVDAMRQADAMILAAPTYFLGANAGLKRLIDRAFSFYAYIDQMWGTPSVGICIAGIPGKEGHGLLGVDNFLKIAMTDIKATRVVYGALPGEVFLSEENRLTAADLGAALFKPAPVPDTPRCPVCGGDTFRFLGGADVRCMLCSNRGTMEMRSGVPVLSIERSEHDFFLTKSEILKHRDWLLGMKSRFTELKDELKSVSLDYRQDGIWIKPEKPS